MQPKNTKRIVKKLITKLTIVEAPQKRHMTSNRFICFRRWLLFLHAFHHKQPTSGKGPIKVNQKIAFFGSKIETLGFETQEK